jgi:outer membrane receptor for ferrienterochelin and colicin
MTEDATALSEVQVVGYGIQKKASVVGAISNIEMKELRQAAPSNLSNALSGRVPGLIARIGDGSAGGIQSRYQSGTIDDAQIFIRGKATYGNTAALILIDGVEGSLSRLNP